MESPRAKYSYLNDADADTDVSNTWMAEEIRILLGQRRLGVGGEKKAIDVIVITYNCFVTQFFIWVLLFGALLVIEAMEVLTVAFD